MNSIQHKPESAEKLSQEPKTDDQIEFEEKLEERQPKISELDLGAPTLEFI